MVGSALNSLHGSFYLNYIKLCNEQRCPHCVLLIYEITMTSLVAQTVKNPSAMQEAQVRSLGQEDPLEKGMATHSSVLAWRIPWMEEPASPRGCKESDRTERLTLLLVLLTLTTCLRWCLSYFSTAVQLFFPFHTPFVIDCLCACPKLCMLKP